MKKLLRKLIKVIAVVVPMYGMTEWITFIITGHSFVNFYDASRGVAFTLLMFVLGFISNLFAWDNSWWV